MERTLGKLLAKLEIMVFEATNAYVEGNKITIVIKGVPDREISMLVKTESWKVNVENRSGVMRVEIEGSPENIERDLDDIVSVIVNAILLTIPRLLSQVCNG
jgi:hypothetical protein